MVMRPVHLTVHLCQVPMFPDSVAHPHSECNSYFIWLCGASFPWFLPLVSVGAFLGKTIGSPHAVPPSDGNASPRGWRDLRRNVT